VAQRGCGVDDVLRSAVLLKQVETQTARWTHCWRHKIRDVRQTPGGGTSSDRSGSDRHSSRALVGIGGRKLPALGRGFAYLVTSVGFSDTQFATRTTRAIFVSG